MAEVDIKINGRIFKITCENGQEQRLHQLASYLNRHVTELSDDLGQIGDARLMLLSALTICDELFEARAKMKSFAENTGPLDPDTLNGACQVLEAATERVGNLSARLGETRH